MWKSLLFVFIGASCFGFGLRGLVGPLPEKEVEVIVRDTLYVEQPPLTDWELLKLAIMKTESEFNPKAEGVNAYGIMQITPVYVKECNRILDMRNNPYDGEYRYSIGDAYDVDKSLDMFDLIQQRYNPEKDIMKAVELHNPNGSMIGYPDKVIRNYNHLLLYERARGSLRN